MSSPFGRVVTFGVFVLTVLLVSQRSETHGCAAVGRDGKRVSIVNEDAIIVWDAVRKTQHFIRRASFQTLAPDFGFLVPTPTAPKLSEVEDAAFGLLRHVILPKVRHVFGGFQLGSMFLPTSRIDTVGVASEMKKSEMAPPKVKVIDRAKVGGFDAVVLEASDPVALEEWLKKNGYPSSPELSGWLGPYLTQKWMITAFKIEQQDGRPVTSAKAVKMSFATEKPFFPYREPDAKSPANPGDRLLRVYFLSNQRMAGQLGSAPWHAKTEWADVLDKETVKTLVSDLKIPQDEFPSPTWLTAFEDNASPRPGSAEVFFDASSDRSAVHPPDILIPDPPIIVPLELVIVGGIVLILVGTYVVRKLGWKK